MGDFHWDDRGLSEDRDVLLTQWQEGELRFVYPTGEFDAVVDMVFPKPEF
jgi:branched-chain amino acid transport system substrate-binding protein